MVFVPYCHIRLMEEDMPQQDLIMTHLNKTVGSKLIFLKYFSSFYDALLVSYKET